MTGHLWKLALVVALSHWYRNVGRRLGPRWAGLVTALPCSTAVALLGGGSDRGVDYAVAMAGACWVGLAGASALPLGFAAALNAGWGWARAALAGIVSYGLVVLGAGALAEAVGDAVGVALAVMGVATVLAGRIGEPNAPRRAGDRALSPRRVLVLRTVVPAACLAAVIGAGEALGPAVAGRLGTFPAMTLTALLLTNLEAGPVPAARMARALPPGNWAMVAFLAAFIPAAPRFGLLAGTGLAYLAAVACLVLVGRAVNPPILTSLAGMLRARRRQLRPALVAPAWPKLPRRFSPGVEAALA